MKKVKNVAILEQSDCVGYVVLEARGRLQAILNSIAGKVKEVQA